jgi:hypothetical protein
MVFGGSWKLYQVGVDTGIRRPIRFCAKSRIILQGLKSSLSLAQKEAERQIVEHKKKKYQSEDCQI